MFTCAGRLPIGEKAIHEVPTEAFGESGAPPPLPPKLDVEETEEASLLPPKPQPRVGSLKRPPPRPPKTYVCNV